MLKLEFWVDKEEREKRKGGDRRKIKESVKRGGYKDDTAQVTKIK